MYTNHFIIFSSLCCVFPLRRWDGSCQSAPIYRTIPKSLFKKCVPYGVSSVTIVWRRQKHQYPRKQQYRQLLFLILTSISKPMPKENLSTPLRLNPCFQPFLHLFISISTCTPLNSIMLFMMSRADCWNICGTCAANTWVQCADGWGDSVLFTFFWLLWHNDWWENMQRGKVMSPERHITNICA